MPARRSIALYSFIFCKGSCPVPSLCSYCRFVRSCNSRRVVRNYKVLASFFSTELGYKLRGRTKYGSKPGARDQ